jgi:hypothetical protein
MSELKTNKRTLYFFINKEIQPIVLTNIPLPTCFLIVLVNKTDMIEFDFLRYCFNSSYDTKKQKLLKLITFYFLIYIHYNLIIKSLLSIILNFLQ